MYARAYIIIHNIKTKRTERAKRGEAERATGFLGIQALLGINTLKRDHFIKNRMIAPISLARCIGESTDSNGKLAERTL